MLIKASTFHYPMHDMLSAERIRVRSTLRTTYHGCVLPSDSFPATYTYDMREAFFPFLLLLFLTPSLPPSLPPSSPYFFTLAMFCLFPAGRPAALHELICHFLARSKVFSHEEEEAGKYIYYSECVGGRNPVSNSRT